MKFDCIERRLAELYANYARVVTRWPSVFILVPFITTAILSCGCVWHMRVLKDDLALYTPENGQAPTELRTLNQHFYINDTDAYFAERRYDMARSGYILVTGSQSNQSVITPDVFQETVVLWNKVLDLSIAHNGVALDYDLLCVRVNHTNACVQNPLLLMFQQGLIQLDQLKYPLTDLGIFIGGILGGVEIAENQTLLRAKAILLPYQLKFSNPKNNQAAEAWELALNSFLTNYNSSVINAVWWTSETLAREADKDTKMLVMLMGPLFALVTAFTVISCMVADWVRSKPWLALAGVVSASSAVASAVGLLSFAGMNFTSVAYFMPYIIFSIGVDNVFILLAAWRKTSIHHSVADRMAETFRDAGVSITVTQLTDGLSFAVGIMTNLQSVRIFCIYASTAILFVYLYQVTFFAGFMVLTGRREAAGRNCITCLVSKRHLNDQLNKESSKSADPFTFENSGIINTACSMFFKTTYTNFITQPFVKCIIVLSFFVYVAFAAWGCTQLRIGLEPRDLLPQNSLALRSLEDYEMHFSAYGDYLHLFFTNLTSDLNYDAPFWEVLEHEVDRFENTPYSGYSDSWLRVFLAYVKTSNLFVVPQNFMMLLNEHFLANPNYQKYKRDITFNVIGTRLSAVRFPVRLKNFGYQNQTKAMHFFRNLTKTSNLRAHVFHDTFLFADQTDTILPALLQNIGLASAAVVGVALLLIPKPICAVWLSLTILSINVGIIGYMSLWGVKLDFVSMVTIDMAIGFCVDFAAHIAYHFAKDRGLSSLERVRDALTAVGAPILQFSGCTFIGIAVLVVVDNYVYRSFLKTTLLIILLGLYHGLVVLPVLLTLFYCEAPKLPVQWITPHNELNTVPKQRHGGLTTPRSQKSKSKIYANCATAVHVISNGYAKPDEPYMYRRPPLPPPDFWLVRPSSAHGMVPREYYASASAGTTLPRDVRKINHAGLTTEIWPMRPNAQNGCIITATAGSHASSQRSSPTVSEGNRSSEKLEPKRRKGLFLL